MSYVPALCLGCSAVTLLSIRDAQSQPTCAACGAEARVVPGCSFAEAERAQFEELSEMVTRANITHTDAQRFSEESQRAISLGTYARLLEKLTERLSGLLPMQVAAGKNLGAQRRILLKLQTIFAALATAHRTSAEYPIASKLPPPRAEGG